MKTVPEHSTPYQNDVDHDPRILIGNRRQIMAEPNQLYPTIPGLNPWTGSTPDNRHQMFGGYKPKAVQQETADQPQH